MLNVLLLLAGFALLIKGADLLVDSASKLARIFHVSAFIIGLSVVAFGTSAPESAIGIFSAARQANELTLGDVVGSSIVNVALIIGISALILPLAVEKSTLLREIPMSLLVQVILLVMSLTFGLISRLEAGILLALFALFLYYIITRPREDNAILDADIKLEEMVEEELHQEEEPETRRKKIIRYSILFVIGLAGLVLGGNLVIESSISIAHGLGMSETLIGLTIVAFGTSLPELVTCIMAALKKESDIAIGNIIGSNIFNVLFVLGLSCLIHPIPVAAGTWLDILVMIGSTLLLLLLAAIKKSVTRLGGALLLAYYVVYITYKILTV